MTELGSLVAGVLFKNIWLIPALGEQCDQAAEAVKLKVELPYEVLANRHGAPVFYFDSGTDPQRYSTLERLEYLILNQNTVDPIPGKYVHYKGRMYTVIGVASTHDTGEKYVIYTSDKGEMFSRPRDEFMSRVNVTNGTVPRFTWISA